VRVLRVIGRRVGGIARLTGLSAWHGLIGFYHSDNLSYAASIAYYALLSLFPFLLLAFTLLGRAAADPQQRTAVFWFVLQYFPKQFDFVTRQLDAFLISDSTSRGLWRWSGARWGFSARSARPSIMRGASSGSAASGNTACSRF
jgi:uncharacterized BrkB/YihY/UPF0761 family membrane protein